MSDAPDERMRRGSAGSAPVSAIFGLVIFLGFVLISTQALIHSYATSVVTSVAFDAARQLSAEGGCGPDNLAAERIVLRRLSPDASAPEVHCSSDVARTSVTIVRPSPARVLGLGSTLLGETDISRTAHVTTEQLR